MGAENTELITEREMALAKADADGLDIERFRARIKYEKERLALMSEFVKGQMVKGVDYGPAFPGSDKPTLLKPGAEKLANIHGLHAELELISQECDRTASKSYKQWNKKTRQYREGTCLGYIKYSFKCRLVRNGIVVCEGVGSCNSWENRYVMQDGDTVDNTLMKVAKKRAYVDATLTATRMSNRFTQDTEDMTPEDPEIPVEVQQADPPPPEGDEPPPTTRPDDEYEDKHVDQKKRITGPQASRLWGIAFGAAKKCGATSDDARDMVNGILEEHGYAEAKEVRVEHYDTICQKLERWGRKT